MLSESKAIGGYFELELPSGKGHYYPDALKYQSARSAFYALLLYCQPRKVWMPYYICDSMLAPLKDAGIEVCFYSINSDFTIKDKIELKDNELLLYVNYFGICSKVEDQILREFDPKKVVFDHSQAFFTSPRDCLATIYSPRKFFGVPDGGYLVTNLPMYEPVATDHDSVKRSMHLMKRLAGEPEDGYLDYQIAENTLNLLVPKRMSHLTDRLLSSIDYPRVKDKREANFITLHEALKDKNNLEMRLEGIPGPMVYPMLTAGGGDVRSNLLKKRFFVATYWPECKGRAGVGSVELFLASNIVPLPCDQRYGSEDFHGVADEF